LESLWTPALARAREEEAALQEIVAEEGGNFKVAPWDWRFYAQKRRRRLIDLAEGELKPYLQLDRMIEAAFFVADRLFGLSFIERFDIPLYHSDTRCWTVLGRDGAPVALFIGDYFARPSKRSGAWDEAKTLFHEFGHALCRAAIASGIPSFASSCLSNVFCGLGYAAGYYSYLWSEVLDADGFEDFEARGDIFAPDLAKKLYEHVYSAGNSRDPEIAYAKFRSRLPKLGALMCRRGFAEVEDSFDAVAANVRGN
jgi:Zn-dependent oligopeptidase